jgi:hypothetical protein
MNKKEIIQNNKLIAAFMINGDKLCVPRGKHFTNGMIFSRKAEPEKRHKNLTIDDLDVDEYIPYFEYHYSWEWIMPVIEKIESLDYSSEIYCIGGFEHRTQFFSCGICPFKAINFKRKLESVYDAVINFIRWYNENR